MYTYWKYITLSFLFVPLISFASFPSTIPAEGEKSIIVDPQMHMWAAYNEDGKLVKTGMATLGNSYCRDLGRSCRTKVGTFRIESLGDAGCKSRRFPLPRGGAPMPYCMFFHGGYALHGSYEVPGFNASHGCIRLFVNDARWLNQDFTSGAGRVPVLVRSSL